MGNTEAENKILELMRELALQDSTLKYIPEALIDVLSILKSRGADYNGDVTGVMEQVYEMGDMSAYVHASRPFKRMKQILSNNGIFCSEQKIGDKINDGLGYTICWKCCRIKAKKEGLGA